MKRWRCRKKYEVVDEDDRISKLPAEPILHEILSLLSTKEAIRTCVLSKSLNSAWNSFPVLDFNQNYFRNLDNFEEFYNYVNNSIARHRAQDIDIHKFDLLAYYNNQSQCEDLDRWLDYATSNNVEHLVLYYFQMGTSAYKLPASALFRAKSLKALDLLGLNLVNFGMDHDIGYFSLLKKLKLLRVSMDDQTLQSLLSNDSLFLEEVSIRQCYGFQSVSLCGTKLKSVELHFHDFRVQKITIEAPNLRLLSLGGECAYIVMSKSPFEASKYNRNVKELVLRNIDIMNAVFGPIREFRVLEKLKLISCSLVGSIRISSYPLSDLAVSDTTVWLKNGELVAECLDCSKKVDFAPLKNGLYKLGIN